MILKYKYFTFLYFLTILPDIKSVGPSITVPTKKNLGNFFYFSALKKLLPSINDLNYLNKLKF